MIGSLPERFWKKVNKTATCWLWTASQAGGGYGSYYYNGRWRPAHIAAYETLKGDIPKGLDLDHLCRVRLCVNPDHLEPVTRRENLLRGVGHPAVNAAKTECLRGHPLSGENLRIGTGSHRGRRICMECDRLHARSAYHRNKSKKQEVSS